MTKIPVIDLLCGLGGRSLAFEKAGYEVVCAVEGTVEDARLYQEVCKPLMFMPNDIRDINPVDLPEAEVILAKLISPSLVNVHKERNTAEEINSAIYNIIEKKRPECFVFEAPLNILTMRYEERTNSILKRYADIGYDVFYKVFNEQDYSGFPVIARQLFFVGIKIKASSERQQFQFPQAVYRDRKNDFLHEEAHNIDSWYRKIGQFEDDKCIDVRVGNFYKREGGKILPTDSIHLGYRKENYIADDIGLRRFTHNELASLKGLTGTDYNKCSNKNKMYYKIAYSTNFFVAKAIAETIYQEFYSEIQKEEVISLKYPKKEIVKQKINPKKVVYPKQQIINIHIDELKGLHDLDINIEKNLIALMGVNGAGKSTILHALACAYRPHSNGDNYKFSFFFTPNPNASWKNSRFAITYFDENEQKNITRDYKKQVDRWAPRYEKRPIRDTFYFGIDTCIPEIELEKQVSFIDYVTEDDESKNVEKIIKDASYILNKDYQKLTIHATKKKRMFGVRTASELTYSSLSMGAGEQRVIKILQKVYSMSQYSLLLIDEIDLLLHVTALKRLIIRLSEIAKDKQLQIMFTTHSLEMNELSEYVDIRYIDNSSEKTLVYNKINADMIYELSEKNKKILEIYVEDKLAEAIVRRVAQDLQMQGFVNITKYGAATNAFIIAASYILKNENHENVLIIIDGDVYTKTEEKKKEIEKILSGTEKEHEEKVRSAISMISDLNLPSGFAPEKYIYNMLIEMDEECEIVKCAKRLNAVSDSHGWLDEIVREVGQEDILLYQIIELVSENPHWASYIQNIREWLIEKRESIRS